MPENRMTVNKGGSGFYSALLRIMESEHYSDICVSRITVEAGKDRSTFYRYFEDKEDLLVRSLQILIDTALDEIGCPDNLSIQGLSIMTRRFCRLLDRNKRALKVLFGPHSPIFIPDIFRKAVNEFCRKTLLSFARSFLLPDMLTDLAEIIGSCVMGAINFRVKESACWSAEKIAADLAGVISNGINVLSETETDCILISDLNTELMETADVI